jgi:iron-sulfur cluster assembly protein
MEITERPIDTLLTLTPVAAGKVRELMAEEPDGEDLVLRVAIQGGGCSGFQYGLGFDTGAAEGDVELSLEGVNVVVDPFSAPYLQGATIDYLNGLQESGFKIENPNAVSSCGCGHSFQVEEGEELPEGTSWAAAAPAVATELGASDFCPTSPADHPAISVRPV